MKERFEKIATKVANAKTKATTLATTAMLTMPMMAQASTAAGAQQAGNMITRIAEIIVDIFPFIGAFFLISGVFKLILAYRNDQPEAQAGAAKDIVVGVVFIVFKVLVWPVVEPMI